MSKKKKGSYFVRTARWILIQWLRARGVDVGSGTKTDELVRAYSIRTEKIFAGATRNECLFHAAQHADRRFIFPAPQVAARQKTKRKKPGAGRPRQPKDKVAAFYKSAEWKRARYDALQANDGRCELCGQGKHEGQILNVDHIKPVRRFWKLRLEPSNLQVLCGDCNCGKGNRDDTDWREAPAEPSLRVLMGEAIE